MSFFILKITFCASATGGVVLRQIDVENCTPLPPEQHQTGTRQALAWASALALVFLLIPVRVVVGVGVSPTRPNNNL